jgi:hypothetical protein
MLSCTLEIGYNIFPVLETAECCQYEFETFWIRGEGIDEMG